MARTCVTEVHNGGIGNPDVTMKAVKFFAKMPQERNNDNGFYQVWEGNVYGIMEGMGTFYCKNLSLSKWNQSCIIIPIYIDIFIALHRGFWFQLYHSKRSINPYL